MLFNKFIAVGVSSLLFILLIASHFNGVVSECNPVTSKLQGGMGNVSICYHPQYKTTKTCPTLDSLFTNPEDITSFARCEVASCSSISGSQYTCKEWKTTKNSDCCLDVENARVCLNPVSPTGNVKSTIWKIYRVVMKDNCGSDVYSEVVIPNTRFATGFVSAACERNFPTKPTPNAQCSGPKADGQPCSIPLECQSGKCHNNVLRSTGVCYSTVANGNGCQQNYQCISGYCDTQSCAAKRYNMTNQERLVCGTCAAPPAPGCTTNADCPVGQVCDGSGNCGAPPGCSTDSDCNAGQKCNLPSKRGGGSGTCVNLAGNGGNCNVDADCSSGYCEPYCVKRDEEMTEHERYACRLATGTCGLRTCSVNADCNSGQRCSSPTKRGVGTCVNLLNNGQSCDMSYECNSGYCDQGNKRGGSSGTCAVQPAGCSTSADCSAGERCDSGSSTCVALTTNGNDCEADDECSSGYCEPNCIFKRGEDEISFQSRCKRGGAYGTCESANAHCTTDEDCDSDERCDVGGKKRTTGECIALLDGGDSCSFDDECKSKKCNPNSCNGKRGVNMTEEEKRSCARGLSKSCAYSCDIDSDCGNGERCHVDQLCKRGMESFLTEDQQKRCTRSTGDGFCYVPTADEGECNYNWECSSGWCETSTSFPNNVNKPGKCYTPISNNQACNGDEWRCYSKYCPGGSTCQASCLLGNTQIFMADGVTQKSVIELEVGDKILGTNGAPATLLYVSDETAKVTYSINDSPTFFTREHAFTVPNHPELIQAVDINFSPRTAINWSPYNNSKMHVGSNIYKWNPSGQNFDSVVINDLQATSRDVEVPVHVFIVHEAARRGGHVAEGYLAQSRRDHSNTLTYAIRAYIVNKTASEFDASLQDYISRGGDLRGKPYFKALSAKTFDVLSANLNNYTKSIARDTSNYDAWDSAMHDYIVGSNPLHDAYAEVIAFKMGRYVTPLAFQSVATGKNFIDNSFIPFLTAVLRSVKIN